MLLDRRRECQVLAGLTAAVRAGESRALVRRGEPGVGKTALLEYLVGQVPDCRVARAAGVESEMELAFAGMHQRDRGHGSGPAGSSLTAPRCPGTKRHAPHQRPAPTPPPPL